MQERNEEEFYQVIEQTQPVSDFLKSFREKPDPTDEETVQIVESAMAEMGYNLTDANGVG